MTSKPIYAHLMTSFALGAFLAAAPIGLRVTADGLSFAPSHAFARDGKEDSSGGRGSDDHGGSGRGKSDTSGSGGSGGEDHGGSDKGGSDDHGGKSAGSGRGSDDQGTRGDDHRGGGADSGDDKGGKSGRGGRDDRPGQDDKGGAHPSRVAIRGTGIEVVNGDGTREEIENGVYERKASDGRSLIERPATQADFDRLVNATRRPDSTKTRTISVGSVRKVESQANALEVVYSTGWREELANGQYELKDPDNNTVVKRAATQKDLSRLRALADN